MDHCRGFLNGIKRGCKIGPLVCVAFASLLIVLGSESVQIELGPPGVLVASLFAGVPLGAVTGAFVGAIHDALRINDVQRWIVVIGMLPICLLFVMLLLFG